MTVGNKDTGWERVVNGLPAQLAASARRLTSGRRMMRSARTDAGHLTESIASMNLPQTYQGSAANVGREADGHRRSKCVPRSNKRC